MERRAEEWKRLETQYLTQKVVGNVPGMPAGALPPQGLVVIDDVLSEAALQSLLDHCLESTIWSAEKSGYLGAYVSWGELGASAPQPLILSSSHPLIPPSLPV